MPIYSATVEGTPFEIELENGRAKLNGADVTIEPAWFKHIDAGLSLILDGQSYDLRFAERDEGLVVSYSGRSYNCDVLDKRLADLRKRAGETGAATGKTIIKSPMPGLIVKLTAEVGQAIKKGERILILEAMKMENDVKAPRDGKLVKISVQPGDAVEGGKELAIIE